jgi:outer membrane receptor for ferrienterochelin and colicin
MSWTSYARPTLGFGTAMLFSVSVAAQEPTQARDLSLDSLLSTHISTASKYAQTTAQAPASVTILTSDDIKQYGYQNLQEVLESVPGFYASYDRNYPYIGIRGFSRPSDYNNRILLLLDGQTLNEQVWGAAMVGSDFPINLDAVERIEVVRGPGSALYGTSAMFAVVNIITKTGTQLDGVTASGRLGSGRSRQAAMTAGHSLGARGSIAASGLVTHTDGNDLYYPEFNAPTSNNGVTHGTDWEHSIGGLAAIHWGDVAGQIGYRSRAKGIPTGAYGSTFDDPRTSTIDETFWGELGARRDLGAKLQLSWRAYGDRYRYRGTYPTDNDPGYTDGGASTDLGGEGLLVWEPASRNRLTLGSEIRRVFRATYYERFTDGTVSSDNAPFTVSSIFAENEFQLFPRVTLFGGLRLDENSRGHDAVTPRLAVVATPDASTTIKALYGQAFRAPSTAEADITTSFYTRNPSLQPERITTFELDAQRRIGTPLLVGASLYHYELRNLIDQVEIEDPGGLQFRNVEASNAVGMELQVDALPDSPLSAHLTYAVQNVHDEADQTLTNSPQQVARLAITGRRASGLRSAVELRYESGRRTLAGPSTPAFVRTNVSMGYSPVPSGAPAWLRGAEISLRVTNLFNAIYATPGGVEHRQSSIVQDGRTLLFRFDWRL